MEKIFQTFKRIGIAGILMSLMMVSFLVFDTPKAEANFGDGFRNGDNDSKFDRDGSRNWWRFHRSSFNTSPFNSFSRMYVPVPIYIPVTMPSYNPYVSPYASQLGANPYVAPAVNPYVAPVVNPYATPAVSPYVAPYTAPYVPPVGVSPYVSTPVAAPYVAPYNPLLNPYAPLY